MEPSSKICETQERATLSQGLKKYCRLQVMCCCYLWAKCLLWCKCQRGWQLWAFASVTPPLTPTGHILICMADLRA